MMTRRMVFALLLGLVGAWLIGCTRTSPEISSFELGKQLQKISSDLNYLSITMTQLKHDSGRIRAEIPQLWEEIRATDELIIKLAERLAEVDTRVTTRGSVPPPPNREVQQRLESLLKQAQDTVARVKALEAKRSEPRQEERSGTARPAAASGQPSALTVGMSPEEVRAKLGEPRRIENTPAFLYWHYGTGKYVYFDQTSGAVQGWLGL